MNNSVGLMICRRNWYKIRDDPVAPSPTIKELSMSRRFFLAPLLLLGCVTTLGAATGDDVSKELQAAEKKWAAGAMKQDVTFMQSLVTDDYTMTNPVGQVVPGKVLLDKIKDSSFKVESLDYSDMKVRVYGDTAVVTGHLVCKGTWEGNDVGGDYAFTDTFSKIDGHWREVASQVTRIEQ
jgi:ketosteroid isomerase-like protein